MTMNPEVKSKWVSALRSGEYEQGKGWLNQANLSGGREYCCLGVLCELARAEGVISDPEEEGDFMDYGATAPDEMSLAPAGDAYGMQFPPDAVAEWAGLPYFDPTVTVKDEDGEEWEDTLSTLNDDGKTFDEIADLIEKQL